MAIDGAANTYIPPSNGLATSQMLNRVSLNGADPAQIGKGTLDENGPAPNALPGLAIGVIMASLSAIMPKMSGDQLDVLVASFTEKAKEMSDASDKSKITADETQKRQAIEAKKSKIDDSIQKQNDAAAAAANASIGDKIKLAFQFLGAALTILGGILACATGIGSVGGGLMIAAGILMLTMAIDSTVQTAEKDQGKGDLGMFGMMCKACALDEGKSDEEAETIGQHGAMGMSIALGVTSAILGIAGGIVGMTSLAGTSEDVVSQSVSVATRFSDISSDVSTAGDATASIYSGVENYKSSNAQADAKTDTADNKRFEGVQDALDAMIDLAMGHLKTSGDTFAKMLDSVMEANSDRGITLSHAQFRA